jgi:hypothetical protein
VLDRILEGGMYIERVRGSLRREFRLEPSTGFGRDMLGARAR